MEDELTFLLVALAMLLFGRYTGKVLDKIEPPIARGAAGTARNILGVTRRRGWADLERMAILAAFAVLVVVFVADGEYFTLGLLVASASVGAVYGRVGTKYLGGYAELGVGVGLIIYVSAVFAYYQIWGEVSWLSYVIFALSILFGGTYIVTGVHALRAKGSERARTLR